MTEQLSEENYSESMKDAIKRNQPENPQTSVSCLAAIQKEMDKFMEEFCNNVKPTIGTVGKQDPIRSNIARKYLHYLRRIRSIDRITTEALLSIIQGIKNSEKSTYVVDPSSTQLLFTSAMKIEEEVYNDLSKDESLPEIIKEYTRRGWKDIQERMERHPRTEESTKDGQ
jgi:Ni,Fe-hydrogenase I large subunit